MISQSWAGSAWENSVKITYSYDGNNNLTSTLNQDWDGEDWENTLLESYTYNASNKKITSLMQIWMDDEWYDEMKSTYTYDNDNLINEITEIWNFIGWENYSSTAYTYGAANNLISAIEQLWEEDQWVNSQKAEYNYDQNMNMTNTMVQAWDGSTWLNFYQMSYSYDANNFTQFLVWKKWSPDGTFVAMGDSMYIYYHTVLTGITDPKESNVTLYPNPCKGELSVSSSNPITAIEIYSLTGNKLYSDYNFKQHDSNEINLTGYTKGVYVMRIYYGTKFISKKVIIQ